MAISVRKKQRTISVYSKTFEQFKKEKITVQAKLGVEMSNDTFLCYLLISNSPKPKQTLERIINERGIIENE